MSQSSTLPVVGTFAFEQHGDQLFKIMTIQKMENTTDLLSSLRRQRFSLHSEKALQTDIEDYFIKSSIDYQREVRLSQKDIIDFLLGSVGIEVKLAGSAKDIYRQVERYCQHPEIEEIVLVTNRIIHLPKTINNKPTHVINLGAAWL
jgi:hypothetical protein